MTVGGRSIGWLIALLVLAVCIVLVVRTFPVVSFVLTPLLVLGLIGALALAIVL